MDELYLESVGCHGIGNRRNQNLEMRKLALRKRSRKSRNIKWKRRRRMNKLWKWRNRRRSMCSLSLRKEDRRCAN